MILLKLMSVSTSDVDSDSDETYMPTHMTPDVSESESDVKANVHATKVEPKTWVPNLIDGLCDVEKKLFAKGPNVGKDKIDALKQCDYCTKWFGLNMFIPKTTVNDERQCLHCYFYFSYEPMACRIESDKKYADHGISIVNYVLNCHAQHDTQNCTHSSPLCCYLCEYKLGMVIDGIENASLLYGTKASESAKPVSDKLVALSSELSDDSITIIMNDDSLFNSELTHKGKPQLLTI
jgi:hypothetical protein